MRVAILLVAGSSRRFGAANKLFAIHRGRTLLARAIALAEALPVQRILLVTGAQGGRVAAAARTLSRRVAIVHAASHREGMGASLRAASRRLRPIDREALVMLADMPWLSAESVAGWLRRAMTGDAMVRPTSRGRPGHPVLLRGATLAALATAKGDKGIGRRAHGHARLIPADRTCIADVDRPSALARRAPRLR